MEETNTVATLKTFELLVVLLRLSEWLDRKIIDFGKLFNDVKDLTDYFTGFAILKIADSFQSVHIEGKVF